MRSTASSTTRSPGTRRSCCRTCRRSTATSSSPSCWPTSGATRCSSGPGSSSANKLTVSSELQADCFAGAWSKHAQKTKAFKVTAADLDTALAGILDLRDNPGTSATDASAHGSGFDRVSAFQDGFDDGPKKCKSYEDGTPIVLELPFNSEEDAASGGDAPYDTIVNKVPYDIEDYWTQVFPKISNGKAWTPLKDYEPFDPAKAPTCNGQPTTDFSLFYCVPEDYIGFDNVTTMPEVYRQGGDYAVTTLLATQWGLAALARLGDESDAKVSTLRGDCFAGAYSASVILHDRKETSTFSISPGDLDEGIKALLVFRGEGDVTRQGAGYGRVAGVPRGRHAGRRALRHLQGLTSRTAEVSCCCPRR